MMSGESGGDMDWRRGILCRPRGHRPYLEAGVALGVAAGGARGADDNHASALAAARARHLDVVVVKR